jgi:diaminopimelate decarboxylase
VTPFPTTAVFEGGRLRSVGGVDVDELVQGYGTPLYVLDRAEVVGRMRAYRAAFGDDVTIAYASKALCVVGVLQLAAREGLAVDVASAGELATAARAGVPMERVLFHGNNKSVAELEDAARLGVGRVVADSFAELDRLEAVGDAFGHRFAVLLRVTPGVEAHTHEFIRTGHDDSKFGFTLSAGFADEAVDRALALAHVDVRGAHCHIGSQIFNPEAFAAAAQAMCAFLAGVRTRHGRPLDELNLGGGLGIAYTTRDTVPSVEGYAETVLAAVGRAAAAHDLGVPHLTVEPGRSIVGPAGLTLYTVGTVKRVPGVRTYVSVDGGMSDNLRPALYGADYTFVAAGSGARDGDAQPVTVVGKHCESGDVLGRDVALPADLGEGDLLAVAATGAYGYAMANNYNRLPRPAMVLVGDGRADLLVRRETLDDVVALDVPLPG